MNELIQLRDRMNDIKQEMAKIAKQGLPDSFKWMFEEWPEIEAIRWSQYTPYFNDGDACVFGVNDAYVKIGEEGGDFDNGYLEEYDFEQESQELERLKNINSTLESIEDVLFAAFGDHCQVTIWRDKNEAEVESYNHD